MRTVPPSRLGDLLSDILIGDKERITMVGRVPSFISPLTGQPASIRESTSIWCIVFFEGPTMMVEKKTKDGIVTRWDTGIVPVTGDRCVLQFFEDETTQTRVVTLFAGRQRFDISVDGF